MTYVIVATREFYGPETRRSLVSKGTGYAETFETMAAAKARIAELDGERYYTGHNESGRPVYKARKTDSLPAYLAQMV